MHKDVSEHKHVELERDQYCKFFTVSSDLMCIADLKGYFRKVNPAFKKTLGYTETELLSKPYIAFVHPDDRQATLDVMNTLAHPGYMVDFENRYLCKDGSYRWLSWRNYLNREEGLNYAIARDITNRKQLEEQLKESENNYHSIADNVPDFLMRYDRQHRHVYANEGCLKAAGMSADEFIGKTHRELGFPENLCVLWETAIDRCFETKSPQTEVFEWESALGLVTLEWRAVPEFSDGGVVTTVLGISRNITDQKNAEKAQLAARERFRCLVEQSIAGIFIIQDGKFVYVNPRFAEVRGYSSAFELIGKDPLPMIADHDRKTVAEFHRRLLAGEIPSINYTFTAMCKDGSSIEVGVHSSLATFGNRPAIIGMLQDISEKKRADELIQQQVKMLEKAFMSTVEVATTLSEMRDPYTAGHERRVAEIAVAISGVLGIEQSRQEGLRVAGYLHDIGKITVPSEILAKPGQLSPTEFLLIKEHAQASYDVLKTVEWPWPVADMVLQHHERMDGSGYPRGLKGDAMLLEARILAVADVVEAMASHRPYRAALGIDAALAEIERGRGEKYDSVVVDACLTLFREKGYAI